MWPFDRTQARAGDLDTRIGDAALAEAATPAPKADRLAAAQAAAGIVGRCFASATPEGDAGPLFTAGIRELIGRQLVLKGEAVLVAGQTANLLPVGSFDIRGGADPASWRYRLDVVAPSGIEVQNLPSASVIHVRVNVAPSEPWRGRSAFDLATATVATATLAEQSAAVEAKMPVARLIPSAGVSTPQQTVERGGFWGSEISKGGLFVIPLGSPRSAESLKRPDAEVIHPEPHEQHVALRRDAAADLLSAAGVPGALVDVRAEAAGQREAFRRLVHGTIEPLARAVENEVAAKLAMELRFDFKALFAADLAGRGRALKQLVDAGVALDLALATVGLGGDG